MKLQKLVQIVSCVLSVGKLVPSLVEGLSNCHNNSFINRIIDEVVLKEKVTGEEDVRCDLCIREDPPVVLCFGCGVFICSHCHESHKYSREYQSHSMTQLKELRKEKKDINVRPQAEGSATKRNLPQDL